MELIKLIKRSLPRASLTFTLYFHISDQFGRQNICLLVLNPELTDRAHHCIVMHNALVAEGMATRMQPHRFDEGLKTLFAFQMFLISGLVYILELGR